MTYLYYQLKNRLFYLLAVLLLMLSSAESILASDQASTCTLKMVFKEGEKEPLIKAMPNNEGVYKDVFSEAAKRIGCQLQISRLPKRRLLRMLERGEIDFYPGSSFSDKRSMYLYYIPNGLLTAEYGITNKGMPELKSYADLKKYSITWLLEFESSKIEKAEKFGVKISERTYLNLSYVSKYIVRSKERNYFYVADKEIVDYFPRNIGMSLDEFGLKVHRKCCEGTKPMYMGFSKKSGHYEEIKNDNYDQLRPLSPENYPTSLRPDSIANKLGEALADMKEEGIIEEMYDKWFY